LDNWLFLSGLKIEPRSGRAAFFLLDRGICKEFPYEQGFYEFSFLPRFWPNRQSDFRVTLACSRRDSFGDAPLKSPFINLSSPVSNFAIRCDLFYPSVVTILLARFGIIVDRHHVTE
jgi:hypothetical protein